MMGNFNRFQQPGMMSGNPAGFPPGNNYGYMPNYRMQNSAQYNMGNPNMGNPNMGNPNMGNPSESYNNHFMGNPNMQRFGGPGTGMGPGSNQFFPGGANQLQGQQQ